MGLGVDPNQMSLLGPMSGSGPLTSASEAVVITVVVVVVVVVDVVVLVVFLCVDVVGLYAYCLLGDSLFFSI
jgi:hypothetical protein